jgi:hypothetical protein
MFETIIVSHLMFLCDNLSSTKDDLDMFRELIQVSYNENIISSIKSLSGEHSVWVDLFTQNHGFLNHTFRLEKSYFEFQKYNDTILKGTT